MARKILLADDSVTAQNMGRKILADAGYEVIAVNNGSAALKKIAELKPDLVILDVYMPGYSGLEVCQRLKESPETARIPVLLTVGKLEPFKPEEAQRVRAEGFIVKPFEASELLSALSKLEDKVVPRAEPSKPGRFARAIAAAGESGRGSRNEPSGEESGWKSRIGFPKQKTEPEEKVADEASIYNPMNRDLRTVVEKPAAETEKKEETPQQPAANVDVAAMAPSGVPKDVTPEEVAAIAAAAAQVQMVASALKDGHQVSEAAPETATRWASMESAPARVEDNPAPLPDLRGDFAPPVETEAKTEARGECDPVGEAPAPIDHPRNDAKRSEETQNLPVTIAAMVNAGEAASTGTSRWKAVSVALEGEEATIALDEEMQKAYSAFAALVANSDAAASAPALEAASAGNFAAQAERALEMPVAQSQTAAAASSLAAVFVASEPASLAESADASSQQPEATIQAPVTPEVAPVEAPVEASQTTESVETHREPSPVAESVSPVVVPEVADSAAAAAQELQPPPEAEPATAEAATATALSAFAPMVATPEQAAEPPAEQAAAPAAEPKEDPETAKSTAAAWETWRQIRDTSKGNEVAEAHPREFDESAPAETAAMAVAAGAEQIPQEPTAAPISGEHKDVASIVDSVLADLRPKLMEEISRKMSKKK